MVEYINRHGIPEYIHTNKKNVEQEMRRAQMLGYKPKARKWLNK